MEVQRWRRVLIILFMLTYLSKAFGMASRPPEGMGATRSVDLSGNVFQFAMPEDFSRDMPADDLVERLDISDPSIFSDPDKGTLIRRWWDIKEPGFFGKKLGTVMMNISVRKVPDNTQHLLGSEPYDVTDRLSFMLMLTEDAQLKHPKNQYTVAPSPERDPFSYYVPDFVTMVGDELHPSFLDEHFGSQVWTRYGVSAPESVLIVNYVVPVTRNVFLEASFYYSHNQDVVARYFRDIADERVIHPILNTLKLDYSADNPVKDIVERGWHRETTQQVVDRHKPQLILKLFGEEAYRDVYLEAPTSGER